jgi:hypothetical protein
MTVIKPPSPPPTTMARRTAPEDDLTRFLLATGLSFLFGVFGARPTAALVFHRRFKGYED